jgi:hypothetical protein
MFRKSLRLAVALAFATLTIGIIACSESGRLFQPDTMLDQNWGRSYEAAKYNQILDPDAGNVLDPVTGMDGVASDNTVYKYDKSFTEKNQPVTNILKLQ